MLFSVFSSFLLFLNHVYHPLQFHQYFLSQTKVSIHSNLTIFLLT
jgi:hypothetical protein